MNITSQIVTVSSAAAFAFQIALALLMLRYFPPEEVGMFSVISQIGFFWTTLALAQTPLRLLANHGASVFDDARQAWSSSVQRFVWLLPIAAMSALAVAVPIDVDARAKHAFTDEGCLGTGGGARVASDDGFAGCCCSS